MTSEPTSSTTDTAAAQQPKPSAPTPDDDKALITTDRVFLAILVVAFVMWELRAEAPMFDVRVFRYGAVIGGGLAIFLVYVTFFGMLFLLPQYLQYVQGRSVVAVGLAMLPFGFVFAVLSPFSARLVQRFGIRAALTGGLLLMALGLIALSLLREIDGYGILLLGAVLFGAGWAAVMAPTPGRLSSSGQVVITSCSSSVSCSAASASRNKARRATARIARTVERCSTLWLGRVRSRAQRSSC